MANLPLKLELPQMQIQWAAALNPVIGNSIVNGLQLNNVSLANGTTVINHRLSRTMLGWFLTDVDGVATVYKPKTAPFNSKTLTLISNAAVTANIWVY
jgi:hypothetical protein